MRYRVYNNSAQQHVRNPYDLVIRPDGKLYVALAELENSQPRLVFVPCQTAVPGVYGGYGVEYGSGRPDVAGTEIFAGDLLFNLDAQQPHLLGEVLFHEHAFVVEILPTVYLPLDAVENCRVVGHSSHLVETINKNIRKALKEHSCK